MDTEKQTVKVNIYGAEYSVKAGDDVDYVQSIASYVNNVMLEIDRNMGSKSPLKVAVLAALNIADELFRKKEEAEKLQNVLDKEAEKLITKINNKIQSLEK